MSVPIVPHTPPLFFQACQRGVIHAKHPGRVFSESDVQDLVEDRRTLFSAETNKEEQKGNISAVISVNGELRSAGLTDTCASF